MTLRSKLPDVGTTIFTVMSRRATEQGAVNVGQGFPDYPIDPDLAACVTDAVRADFNQYAPMEGNTGLRAAIAAKIAAGGGRRVDQWNTFFARSSLRRASQKWGAEPGILF